MEDETRKKIRAHVSELVGVKTPELPTPPEGMEEFIGNPLPAPLYLLVRKASTPSTTKGGIELPDIMKEELQFGRVVAAGSSCKLYKAGEYVILSRVDGHNFTFAEVNWTFIREEGIIGTLSVLKRGC